MSMFRQALIPVLSYLFGQFGRQQRHQNNLVKDLCAKQCQSRLYQSSSVPYNAHYVSMPASSCLANHTPTGVPISSQPTITNKNSFWTPYGSLKHRPYCVSAGQCGKGGLFDIGLHQPQDYTSAAHNAISRCRELCQDINSRSPSAEIIHLLDEISNTVCIVLDSAQLCRFAHENHQWRHEADVAYNILAEYVAELNCDVSLYTKLKDTLIASTQPRTSTDTQSESQIDDNTNAQCLQLSDEQKRVGQMLLLDFERSGIHLDQQRRAALGKLIVQEQQIVYYFQRNLSAGQPIDVNDTALSQHLSSMYGNGQGLDFQGLYHAMCNSREPGTRLQLYKLLCPPHAPNVDLLARLINARHTLARVQQFPSYNAWKVHWATLAQSPTAVQSYLKQVASLLKPLVESEIHRAHRALQLAPNGTVWECDRAFLQYATQGEEYSKAQHAFPKYFPLQTVLNSTAQLLGELLHVNIEYSMPNRATVWSADVSQFTVTNKDDNVVGIIYLDLVDRAGKTISPSHYTIRAYRENFDGTTQAPVAAILYQLERRSDGVYMLDARDIGTLYHELGHALHTVLSRTTLQHLAGTRGSLDIAEIPSYTFQQLARDIGVLQKLSANGQHGPVPIDLFDTIAQGKQQWAAAELQGQAVLACIDQSLHQNHGSRALSETSINQLVREQYESCSSFQLPQNCYVEATYSHLTTYSSMYYTYIYARQLSSLVYQKWLAHDRKHELGAELRQFLFQPGGAKDPLQYVTHLVGDQAVNIEQYTDGLGVAPKPSGLIQTLQQQQNNTESTFW